MSYIEVWAQEYLKHDENYKNHINKFVFYIKEIDKADKPTKINLKDVKNCLGYYNKSGKIKTINSMEIHLESIKAFYKFLVSKSWATDIFGELSNYQGYKKELSELFQLEQTKEREYFDISVLKKMLSTLDDYLEKQKFETLTKIKQQRYLNYLTIRIFIKITLIAPAKRGVISNIIRDNFNDSFRILTINDVNINIPNGLRRDICSSIKIIEKINMYSLNTTDNLFSFISLNNFRAESLNTWFYNLIKELNLFDIDSSKTTHSVEIIRNSAIIALINSKFDLILLSKISGLSLGALEKWYYKAYSYSDEGMDKEINKGISNLDYYSFI